MSQDTPNTLTRRDLLTAAGTVGAVGAGAVGVAGLIGLTGTDGQATGSQLVATRVSGALPSEDPGANTWGAATEVTVPLLAQTLVPPSLDSIGVADLRVRALTNGDDVAFRLSWDDADLDDLDGVDRYHDAVAVMLPSAPGAKPAITMGAKGTPVHILQWRATWQRDLAGKSGVDQIFPRVVHDVMPNDVLPPEVAELYWVGRKAGNPLSQIERTSPVEQVVAEGYGTTTHVRRADAAGHGEHDGTAWAVTMSVPTAREGLGAPLTAGEEWWIAFAVWLGSRHNRGGRKHYADWIPFGLGPE